MPTGTSLTVPLLKLRLPMQGMLVEELRSCKPHAKKPKHKNRGNIVINSIKSFQMVHVNNKKNNNNICPCYQIQKLPDSMR